MTHLLPLLLSLSAPLQAAEIDPSRSTITWRGSKITGDSHEGQIALSSSSLKLEGGEIVSGELIFDLSSLSVSDLSGEWEAKFLGHMLSPDFFDAARFPTARLELTSLKGGQVQGQLTIKGVTRPLIFTTQKADGVYRGEARFDRTEFGITYGSGSFFEDLGDKLIHDTVEVKFSIALKED